MVSVHYFVVIYIPEFIVSISHLMGFQFRYKDQNDANKDEEVNLKR